MSEAAGGAIEAPGRGNEGGAWTSAVGSANSPRRWEFEMVLPREKTLEGLLGLEITERKAGRVCGRMAIRDAVRQPMGFLHGGAAATVAQTLAWIGTLDAVAGDGRTALSLSNNTSFIRPLREGRLYAAARARDRAGNTWVWDVELSDDGGRLCAVSQITVAVRDGGDGENPPGPRPASSG